MRSARAIHYVRCHRGQTALPNDHVFKGSRTDRLSRNFGDPGLPQFHTHGNMNVQGATYSRPIGVPLHVLCCVCQSRMQASGPIVVHESLLVNDSYNKAACQPAIGISIKD